MRFVQAMDTSGQVKVHVGPSDVAGPSMVVVRAEVFDRLSGTQVHSWTNGDMTIATVSCTPGNPSSVIVAVGSDEGLSTETITRLAWLVADVMLFLGFYGDVDDWNAGTTPDMPANAKKGHPLLPILKSYQLPIARRTLNYIYLMMEQHNLPLLLHAFPRSRLLSIYVGFDTIDEMLSGIHNQYWKDETDDADNHLDMPGYACLFLGGRLIEESGKLTLNQCQKMAGPGEPHAMFKTGTSGLSQGDKFIMQLISTACGYVPSIDLSKGTRDEELAYHERVLKEFGINRENICVVHDRIAAVEEYIDHLRTEDGCRDAIAKVIAIEDSLEALRDFQRSLLDCTSQYPNYLVDPLQACYRRPDLPQVRTGQSEDSALVVRCWLNYPVDRSSKSKQMGLLQVVRVAMPESAVEAWREGDALHGEGPSGCDIGMLYFPKAKETQDFFPWSGLVMNTLHHDVRQHLAWANYPLDFFHSPSIGPAIKTPPGLQYYAYVDRTQNLAICCNPVGMALTLRSKEIPRDEPASDNLKRAVFALHTLFEQCVSKAHTLIANGYQEGLWGHLGFQFYFKISVEAQGGQPASANNRLPAGQGGLLPLDVRDTFVHYPHRIGDVIAKNKLTELFCLYVGAVSPRDIVEYTGKQMASFIRDTELWLQSASTAGQR